MAKSTTTVVFVHGMGKHDQTFHEEAWNFLATKHKDLTGSDLDATPVPFVYDDLFEAMRTHPAGALKDLRPWVHDTGVLEAIKEIQSSGDFIYTHALDVLMWRFHPTIRALIVTRLATALMPYIQSLTETSGNLVIVAHSLGTSVMTEVIHFIGTRAVPGYARIPALHMLADVAKVLECEVPAYDPPNPSLCRPYLQTPEDSPAMLLHYFNYRNVLDPFPLVDLFDPGWPESVYHETAFRAWGDPVQPHDILTYVAAPEVHMKLLRSITRDGKTYTKKRENEAIQASQTVSTSGQPRQELFQRLADRFRDKTSVDGFVKLCRAAADMGLW